MDWNGSSTKLNERTRVVVPRTAQDTLERERDEETNEGVLRAVQASRVGLIQRRVPLLASSCRGHAEGENR